MVNILIIMQIILFLNSRHQLILEYTFFQQSFKVLHIKVNHKLCLKFIIPSNNYLNQNLQFLYYFYNLLEDFKVSNL